MNGSDCKSEVLVLKEQFVGVVDGRSGWLGRLDAGIVVVVVILFSCVMETVEAQLRWSCCVSHGIVVVCCCLLC